MNPITDKIRKLLALGRNGAASPNEAATAMAKAQRLTAEHGISLTEIPADDSPGSWLTHISVPSLKGLPQRLASRLIKRHFGVDTLFDSTVKPSVIHIVGTRDQAEIASYVYVYLVRTVRRSWVTRKNRRIRDRESFLPGFVHSISQMLPEVFPQTGLVLSAQHYIETTLLRPGEQTIFLKPSKNRLADKAFLQGLIDGRKAGIRNAIAAPSAQPELPFMQ
jgi:hypothetical protein